MRYFIFLCMILVMPVMAMAAEPARIVALGDSLTAGYGLEGGQSFASRLEIALKASGQDVRVDNAGVSGDTSAGGLARLDWAVSGTPKPALVLVALGANDMLRGLDPKVTQANLGAILKKLRDQNIPALLVGMRSPANMGPDYQKAFDDLYPDLAREYGVPLHPFFLEGVAMNPRLNQADGVHPTLEGVDIMVANILPIIKKTLAGNIAAR